MYETLPLHPRDNCYTILLLSCECKTSLLSGPKVFILPDGQLILTSKDPPLIINVGQRCRTASNLINLRKMIDRRVSCLQRHLANKVV